MNARQRSIFITGAASGIGRETARRFCREGWRIGLSDREADALESLHRELGEATSIHVADVRDFGDLSRAIAQFCGGAGLDALFNCAGILEMRAFAETSVQRLRDIVDVNINGVIHGVQAALPFLRSGHDPHIVNMSSVAAIYGVPEEAVYSASKFAVRGLTEALNIEFEADGIWVSDVMVAYVATPMVLDPAEKARSIGILGVNVQPSQVADTVHAAIAGRKVHWFVTEADTAVASQVDASDWQARRDLMKAIAGF